MKKQNLKMVLLVALVGVNCNAFAYKGGTGKSLTVTYAPLDGATGNVTFQTNGNVKVNDLDYTVTNGETFTVQPGASVELIPEYYSVNGGVGLGIDVFTSQVVGNGPASAVSGITGPNGNTVAGGMYYFPDVDADGTKLETSEVDSLGAADIDATGGGWVTGITTNGGWNGVGYVDGVSTNGLPSGASSQQLNMNYSAPSKGDAQLSSSIVSDGQTVGSETIINGDGY